MTTLVGARCCTCHTETVVFYIAVGRHAHVLSQKASVHPHKQPADEPSPHVEAAEAELQWKLDKIVRDDKDAGRQMSVKHCLCENRENI